MPPLSTRQKLLGCNELRSVSIAVRHHGEVLPVEPPSRSDIARLRRGLRRAIQTAGAIGTASQRRLKGRPGVGGFPDCLEQLALELDGRKEGSFRSSVLDRRGLPRQSFGFIAVPECELQPR